MKIVTSGEIQKIEQYIMNEVGISAALMMENAALAVAKHCIAYLEGLSHPRVMVVAGTGKNGGDGLIVARHLTVAGFETGIIFVGERQRAGEDVLVHLGIAQKLGIPISYVPTGDSLLNIPYMIETCDLVVDALLGVGISGLVGPNHKYMIETINAFAKRVVSVDIPSGVNPDNGQVMGAAIKAHKTVTFGLYKLGLLLYPGAAYAGEIILERIGVPQSVWSHMDLEINALCDEEARKLLPNRYPYSNKGTYGKVFVMAGCADMPGAAVLACMAAYRVGSGLVNACVTRDVAGVIHQNALEVVTQVLPDKGGYLCQKSGDLLKELLYKAASIVLGPGLGRNRDVTDFVRDMIASVEAPIVIDADGLNAVADDLNVLHTLRAPGIITPHMGEMGRLLRLPLSDIAKNPIQYAKDFAKEYEVIVVLKDARTIVVAPSGDVYVNISGNSALAKAGSGDVLAGMVAGLLAQGLDGFTAAILGVYLHGRCGEAASAEFSLYGVNARDIIEYIPRVMASL